MGGLFNWMFPPPEGPSEVDVEVVNEKERALDETLRRQSLLAQNISGLVKHNETASERLVAALLKDRTR